MVLYQDNTAAKDVTFECALTEKQGKNMKQFLLASLIVILPQRLTRTLMNEQRFWIPTQI